MESFKFGQRNQQSQKIKIMKAIIVYILLGLISAMSTHAQSPYDAGMTEAFELWRNEKPTEAANLFERIAKAENDNWLPYYYASQVKIVQSFPMTQPAMKEQLLNEAQELLDEAKGQGGDEVELLVLQAMLHTARLTVDPAVYAMKLSPVITDLYTKASKLAPENPRLALSRTEWNMGSARYFGEDPKVYCPDLKDGLKLFEKEERSPMIAPAWGKERLQMLIAQTCEEK